MTHFYGLYRVLFPEQIWIPRWNHWGYFLLKNIPVPVYMHAFKKCVYLENCQPYREGSKTFPLQISTGARVLCENCLTLHYILNTVQHWKTGCVSLELKIKTKCLSGNMATNLLFWICHIIKLGPKWT